MTAKEYLQNAYKIERRVKIIENKVKKLRSQNLDFRREINSYGG